MINFKASNLLFKEDELCQEIKKAREKKKITLQKASADLKININYLKALEEGCFEKLPEGVYKKNFLRDYCHYLGLNYNDFLQIFLKKEEDTKEDPFSKKIIKNYKLIIFPKILKNILIVFVVFSCLMYLIFSLKEIVAPPFLSVSNPEDNLVLENNFINILGVSEPEAEVTINGELVMIDKEGGFSKKIDLSKGVNEIIIKSKKKYSRENIIIKRILVN